MRIVTASLEKNVPLPQTIEELSQGLVALSSYLSVLDDILPRKILLWKLEMLKTASAYSNSRLHAVRAQTLILCSGRDQFLPSEEEGERLRRALQKCDIRKFTDSGHFLFLEDAVDLVTVIKGATFYRRARYHDYVSDYIPPTPSEFKQIKESYRVRNTSYSGQSSQNLSGWQPGLEPKSYLLVLLEKMMSLKTDMNGEVSNQDVHMPIILPKIPGRFYYFFGKPIETEGIKQELRDREKCHELYLHVKSEVESCLTYLKEKREKDSYRNVVPRLLYQARQGFTSEVPTFEV